MSSTLAGQLIFSLVLVIVLLRPIEGLVFDIMKIMLRLAVVGMVVQFIVPWDGLDNWSQQVSSWLSVAPTIAPGLAMMTVLGLSTVNIPFAPEKAEQVIRIVIYILGGIPTAASAPWQEWARAWGSIVSGIFRLLTSTLGIFTTYVPTQ